MMAWAVEQGNRPACRACGERRARVRLEGHDFDTGRRPYRLLECLGCGLVRTDPEPAPAELAACYREDYYGGGHGKFRALPEHLLAWQARRRAARLEALLGAHRGHHPRVLDVGCGRGLLLGALAARGWECHGLERASTPCPAPAVHLHSGPLEGLALEPGSFDLVVFWHSLEHLEDPAAALRASARLLRHGGLAALATPSLASLQARLFGRHWFHLDLPRHRYHFEPAVLAAMAVRCGLRVCAHSTLAWEQETFGFVQSALNAARPGGRPNALFAAIKGGQPMPAGRRLGWYAAGAALAPLALVELAVSAVLGRGACAIVYARKDREPG